MIRRPIGPDRRQDAQRESDRKRHYQAVSDEQRARQDAVPQDLRHRRTERERRPEVTMKQTSKETAVLLQDRAVEAELVTQVADRLLGRSRPERSSDRVAGHQEVEHEEGHGRESPHDDHAEREAADDVGDHRADLRSWPRSHGPRQGILDIISPSPTCSSDAWARLGGRRTIDVVRPASVMNLGQSSDICQAVAGDPLTVLVNRGGVSKFAISGLGCRPCHRDPLCATPPERHGVRRS
ncbi:hypothetical protein AERO9AM_20770 [Aeromicrobium sp. 9AM]|nr:hypothetical protein AERO9AM_20770 [Aeromicrobium sp. 9AM]